TAPRRLNGHFTRSTVGGEGLAPGKRRIEWPWCVISEQWRYACRATFDNGEAVGNGTGLANKFGVELCAVEVEHQRTEIAQRNEHGRMIECAAAGLTRSSSHGVDGACVRGWPLRWFGVRAIAGYTPIAAILFQRVGEGVRRAVMAINQI